jgi:hypothetical protein
MRPTTPQDRLAPGRKRLTQLPRHGPSWAYFARLGINGKRIRQRIRQIDKVRKTRLKAQKVLATRKPDHPRGQARNLTGGDGRGRGGLAYRGTA